MTDAPIVLHGFKFSGHSHRVELMLRLLDLRYAYRPVDLTKREQKLPAFLALNPFGTVPVLEDGEDADCGIRPPALCISRADTTRPAAGCPSIRSAQRAFSAGCPSPRVLSSTALPRRA